MTALHKLKDNIDTVNSMASENGEETHSEENWLRFISSLTNYYSPETVACTYFNIQLYIALLTVLILALHRLFFLSQQSVNLKQHQNA